MRRGEEQDRSRGFMRRSRSAHRDKIKCLVADLGGNAQRDVSLAKNNVFAGGLGLSQAGIYKSKGRAIYLDIKRGPFARQSPGQSDNARLGCGIIGLAKVPPRAGG